MGTEFGLSFTETLKKISDKDLGLPQLKKAVGSENVLVFKALLDYQKTGKKFADAIKNNSAGASAKMYDIKTAHFMFQMSRLWRSIEEKFIKVYDDFLGPMLTKVTNKLIDFVDWLFSGTVAANTFAIVLGTVVASMTALFVIVSSLFAVGTVILWFGAVKEALLVTALLLKKQFGVQILSLFWHQIPAAIAVSIAKLKLFSTYLWAVGTKTRTIKGSFIAFGNVIKWVGAKMLVLSQTMWGMLLKLPATLASAAIAMKGMAIAALVWAKSMLIGMAPVAFVAAKFAALAAIVFSIGYAIGSLIVKPLTGLDPINPFSMEGVRAMQDILQTLKDFATGKWDSPILREFMKDVTGVERLSKTQIETARMAQKLHILKTIRSQGGDATINKDGNLVIHNTIIYEDGGKPKITTEANTKTTVNNKDVPKLGQSSFGIGYSDPIPAN